MPVSRAELVLASVVVSLGAGCGRAEPAPGAAASSATAPVAEAAAAGPAAGGVADDAAPAALVAPDTGREVPLGVALGEPAPMPAHIAWIVAGGGGTPADNQVSIEADVALARERLGDGGVVLFGGGPGAHGVQVTGEARGDALRALLGDLFDPRGGRRAVYRPTVLDRVQGPATADALLTTLTAALGQGGDPLLVYLAGHGEAAERAADVLYVTWGGRGVSPAELADTLDKAGDKGRVVRLVMSSCYSGAFADLVFEGADADLARPAEHLRCGLFASTWDRPSSGCDPDPDRRQHEGFGVHFLNALGGLDRDGQPLARADIDFDGDGRVSLLEAHARARIATRGFDVPTTTSERWLRAVAPEDDEAPQADPIPMPEEEAVVRALEAQLGLAAGAAVDETIDGMQAQIARLDATLQAATDAEADAVDRVAAVVLARWPVVNDPWHPDFLRTLEGERHELETFFRTSDLYHDYLAARDDADGAAQKRDELSLALAPYLRLQRARETIALATRLKAEGGAAWARYERLRTCERGSAP